MGSLVHRLTGFWDPADAEEFAPAKDLRVISRLEERYGVVLPQDFRAYLAEVAPAADYWDREDVIWWEPRRIQNVDDEYEHRIKNEMVAEKSSKYLFFGDFMIWSWAWAICCEEGKDHGKVVCIGGLTTDRIVADSFSEFLAKYVDDPFSVGPP